MHKITSLVCLIFLTQYCFATKWYVGPTRTYTYCSQVAPLVQHGDSILIDPGTYTNDPQVKWTKNNLVIMGNGSRPNLVAGAIIAADVLGKAIFVISGNDVKVENIEFSNCTVIDLNGAGIRQEGRNLLVTRCYFHNNQNGILDGGAAPNSKVIIEYSEFFQNGLGGAGYSHNIYINNIDTLVYRYNYNHDALDQGHELKSRAKVNFILYNKIENANSDDSRNIDLPNGGMVVLLGNVIEQSQNTVNSNLVAYGGEGLTNPGPHHLYVVNNTFINKKNNGSYFVLPATGMDSLVLKNNIFAGSYSSGFKIGVPAIFDSSNNIVSTSISNVRFNNPAAFDYKILNTSAAKDRGITYVKKIFGLDLVPTLIYSNHSNVEPRFLTGTSIDAGAYEVQITLSTKSIQLMGEQKNGFNYLKWTVPSSNTIVKFELEKKNSSGSFFISQKFDAVQGASFYDFSELAIENSTNLYRLKVFYASGEFDYTNIILLKNGLNKISSYIYPNPASSGINIHSNINGKYSIIVTNIAGTEISRQLTNTTTTYLNTSALSSGIYFITILTQNGEKIASSFVVQH
jgi:hypothetical protein